MEEALFAYTHTQSLKTHLLHRCLLPFLPPWLSLPLWPLLYMHLNKSWDRIHRAGCMAGYITYETLTGQWHHITPSPLHFKMMMSLLGGLMLSAFSFSLTLWDQTHTCTHIISTSFLHLFWGPVPGGQGSWVWVFAPVVGSECWVWRPASWALEGGLEEDNLFVPAPQPHTADTHCAGTAGGWAASPSRHTPGNAAPVPCSSCWTGGERRR